MAADIHKSADVSKKAKLGPGTRIWHQAQVREDAVIGAGCNIGKNVYIDFGVVVGDKVKIQNNVSIYNGVTVEDEVFIGPSAVFTNDLFPRATVWDDERRSHTLVKKGSSIGANSTIICGNTIGRYALVGAGSVVTQDVPDYALVYGNPARIAGYICSCGEKLGVDPGEYVCSKCGNKVTVK